MFNQRPFKRSDRVSDEVRLAISEVLLKNISILFRQVSIDVFASVDRERLKKLFLLLYKRDDIEHKDIFLNAKKILLTKENYIQLKQTVSSDKLLEKPNINN